MCIMLCSVMKENNVVERKQRMTHEWLMLCKAAEAGLSGKIAYEHPPEQRDKVNLADI